MMYLAEIQLIAFLLDESEKRKSEKVKSEKRKEKSEK